MGNCLMAGQGQAPARQAALGAGLPQSAGAVTLSKMCGSGMRAMMFAHDMLKAESADDRGRRRHGEHDQRAAPGVRAQGRPLRRRADLRPHGDRRPGGRLRARPRDGRLRRGVRRQVRLHAARRWTSSRSARPSARRRPTRTAASPGKSRRWRCPARAARRSIKFDEQPFKAKLDKIPGLKPAFKKDGTITAATSSSISDGAAALVLMRESTAAPARLKPIARIVGHARPCAGAEWFTTAPVGAIQKVLKKAGWHVKDVDLWEVNEAFAAVTMAAMNEFSCRTRSSTCTAARSRSATRSAPAARASSSRCSARCKSSGKKKGIAALCIGGGEATAMAVEML